MGAAADVPGAATRGQLHSLAPEWSRIGAGRVGVCICAGHALRRRYRAQPDRACVRPCVDGRARTGDRKISLPTELHPQERGGLTGSGALRPPVRIACAPWQLFSWGALFLVPARENGRGASVCSFSTPRFAWRRRTRVRPDGLPGSDLPDHGSDWLSHQQRGSLLLAGITPGRVGSPTDRSGVLLRWVNSTIVDLCVSTIVEKRCRNFPLHRSGPAGWPPGKE